MNALPLEATPNLAFWIHRISKSNTTDGRFCKGGTTLAELRKWANHATSRKVAGSSPDVNGIFYWPNPSSRAVALGLTQALTEMSTRNLPWGKGRPARKANNLTAICEPIVYKMLESRRLTVLIIIIIVIIIIIIIIII
jgi:hypothetical protein